MTSGLECNPDKLFWQSEEFLFMKNLNIVLDENIPFAREYFGHLGNLTFLPGRTITSGDLTDADALIVRSVTKVNENLLKDAHKLSYVGTCTIGTDHVDKDYLARRGISFASAPGCNRVSVGEYVISSLLACGYELSGKTFGVIGAGNTGTASGSIASLLGATVLYCDPFKEQKSSEDGLHYVSCSDALACDIVTFHVPLTRDGDYPTFHMLDEDEISDLRENQILINASRGDVWNNTALLKRKMSGSRVSLIIDVWENEPQVLTGLIPYTAIATPHIAGYSAEGKLNGTSMIASDLCHRLGIEPVHPGSLLPDLGFIAHGTEDIKSLVLQVYNPIRDDEIFRREYQGPDSFDMMRKNYPGRRQWSALRIKCSDPHQAQLLSRLGFSVYE